MALFEDLPDSAQIHIYPVSPGLTADQQASACSSVEKLLQQFEREGSASKAAVACDKNGVVLLIAYDVGSDADISGCRKDKIAKVLKHCEESFNVCILDAPPMLIEVDGAWMATDRAGLRELHEAKTLSLDGLAYNVRCEDLGTWRSSAIKPIKDMWMKPIVERIVQSA